jgi:hypothetical protein
MRSSLLALPAVVLLMPFIAAAIKVLSPGPVFFIEYYPG